MWPTEDVIDITALMWRNLSNENFLVKNNVRIKLIARRAVKGLGWTGSVLSKDYCEHMWASPR